MKTKAKTNLDRFKEFNLRKDESKHAAVLRLLENQIRQMAHGERIPVVRDLMRKFKVSQNTIDHALVKLEVRNLITRQWGSGIYVNHQTRPQAIKHTVGVVVSNITNPFCALLVKGIERQLAANNQMTIICSGHEQFQVELDTIDALQGRMEGVIINPTTANVHNPQYVRYFSELSRKSNIPFLLVDIPIPGVNVHFAGFDNYTAFFEMAGVLAGAKTRFNRIVYLGALESIIGSDRLSGFNAGLKEHNVPAKTIKIINVPLPVSYIPISPAGLYRGQPTAIVVASPLIFPKLLAFCGEQNIRIPEDVMLAGVLEENFREHIHAPVLGWVKPSIKLGKLSAELIQQLIAGKPAKQITKLALERFIPERLKYLFSR